MIPRWKRGILLIMVLGLAGCYRQAADPLEPINNPTEPPPTAVPNDSQVIQPGEGDLTEFPATATLPLPVTVIQPADNPAATATPVEAQPTMAGDQSLPATSSIPITPLHAASPTVAIITPGGPSGLIIIDTATPTPDLLATATPSGLITPTSLFGEADDRCAYTVQSGDNLFRIAVNHGVTLDELRAANPAIIGDIIQPGQVLTIPDCDVEDADIEPTPEPQLTVVGGGRTHVVQSGETLLAIANRYGVTVQDIVDANNLTDPNQLSVGQELIIPVP
jgi:LysM repeat protein